MTRFKSLTNNREEKMPAKKTEKKVVKKVTTKSTAKKTVVKPVVKPTAKLMAKPIINKIPKKELNNEVATKTTPVMAMPKIKIEPKKLVKPLIFLLVLALVYLLKDEIIVASVNGRPVTRWNLTKTMEKQYASNVLQNITLEMLVEQELKKAGVVVTDEEMNAEISKIEEQLSAQGQNLDDLLAAQGLTRAEVKKQLTISKGLEKLLADKVSASDEEIKAYFEQNKDAIGANAKLEDVSASIKTQLSQQKLVAEQQKWLAEVKKNAKINYFKFAPSNDNLY